VAEVKWIKIVTDIFDDEKILLIESMPDADAIIVIWFKLLCMAGKQNNSGVFLLNGRIAYTDEMFATIFRRPVNTVRLALNTFEQFGMIEIVNNTVTIPNWEKHQKMDALEASREATRKRVARYRERQKQITAESNVTETFGNADRIDKNREEKKIKEDEEETACVCACEDNPFGDGDSRPPVLTTVQKYATDNLRSMSPGNIEEFISFLDQHGVSDDVMRYAIDVACGNGSPVWNYVAQTLYGWLEEGVKTVADAKVAREKHSRSRAAPSNSQPKNPFGIDRRNNKTPKPMGRGQVL